jgi:hypothetical protein
MAELVIRSETTGTAWRVWPETEPAPPGVVHETGSYVFELQDGPEAGAAELLIDERPLEALRALGPVAARWRWSPGFHAGTVEAELRMPGSNPRRFEVVTDPDLRKLTRDDFDGMVREILEDTFALFSLGSFRKSIARGSGTRPPAIARLEFLRSRIDELSAVVAGIVRNPRRMLTADETLLPYHRATRATGPEILKSFRTGKVRKEETGGRPSRLPPALKGFLPELIRVRQRRSSLDIPEHRQMGACLRAWSAWLSAVAETLVRADPEADAENRRERSGWAARCNRLARRLSRMASEAPFAEAANAAPTLMLSAVFRNDPEYRRFFRLWQDMNLGIAAVFGDFLNMPLARTFELYELWCFLRLVRAAAEEFGMEGMQTGDLFITDAAGGLTVASGAVTVTMTGGWKLCFQKQYREFWIEPTGRGSFSRDMTPDVAVMRETGADAERLIILDAKYRIEEGLNAALNSIHTYRDALVHEADGGAISGIVSAAYLLTPHVPELREGYRDTPLPGRLFHPKYRSSFRFGAVTMRPGMTMAELGSALRTITADAGV